MQTSRRHFVIQFVPVATALGVAALPLSGQAQAQPLVSEADPQALALGYRVDGSQTDTKKYPNYAASQSCSACVLFQGKAGDSSASCAVFGNKIVSGKGWCSAWAKKS